MSSGVVVNVSDDDIVSELTPTEYLFMEVLAARARLGEAAWSFPNSVRTAARALESRNLIGWKSGVIENTMLAWMTPLGRTTFLSDEYVVPQRTQ